MTFDSLSITVIQIQVYHDYVKSRGQSLLSMKLPCEFRGYHCEYGGIGSEILASVIEKTCEEHQRRVWYGGEA